jgi:predicted F0F1-ATPase subunit
MNKHDKSSLRQEIQDKALRKLRAKRRGTQSVWFGLGMMGLIGWSVTIPTVLGAWAFVPTAHILVPWKLVDTHFSGRIGILLYLRREMGAAVDLFRWIPDRTLRFKPIYPQCRKADGNQTGVG